MKRQRYIEVPTTWDEMTEADWREVLKIRQRVVENGGCYSMLDITTETARRLLHNRGIRLQLQNPNYIRLVAGLAESLNWLWHTEGKVVSLVYKDTRNLMPTVCEWVGPADHGQDLVFGEFRQAVTHLRAYEQTLAVTPLQALAGLLYRPAATSGSERRLPYDSDTIDTQILRGRQMKPWQLWGIYAWFAWFCEYLTTGTFIIDGSEVSFGVLFEHGADKNNEAHENNGANGLQQICLTLAESHVFGTARDVDRTPLLTVMQKLLMDYHTLQSIRKNIRKK